MQPDDFLSENSAPFLGKDVDATAQENTTPEDAAFNVGVTVDAMLDHLTKGDSYKPKPVDITSDKNAGLGVRPYIVGAEGTATQSIEAYELSGELGVSVGMAAALPDFYKDTRASRTIENNALLSGWAKDSKNAPIAKEYAQELLNGFNASAEVMKQAGWAPRDYDPSSGMAPEIWELLEATRMRAVAGIKEEGEVYNLIGSFAAGIQEIFASAFGAVGYAGNAIENAFTPGELTKEEQLKQAENSFWLRLAEQGHESAAKARPQYDRSKVLQFASDVAEVAPQLAAQLGIGLLTSGSSLPVQVGAQSALMAPQLFESQTRNLIEKGVSPDAAMGWGALTALIEMPLEFIGQKKLFRLGDIRKATGEQAVKDVATTFVAEPLTEGLQGIQEKAVEHVAVGIEEGKTAGEIYSGFVKDLPNILGDSAYDAVLMLPFAFLGAARHISAIRDGKAFNSSMDATRAAWEPIKEKLKNPDLIDGAVKASGINGSVYMSGEDAYTLYQTHPDLEQAFGVSLENVQTASDMGQMVELDASRLISRLSPEQYEQTMEKISHTGAGVATVADFQAERERVLEATEKVFKEDSEFRKEAGRLREELTRLYRESENVKKSAAAAGDNVKAYVDSHIAMFKRLAVMSSGQTGEAPSSVLKRLGARTGLSGQDRNEMYQAPIEKEVNSLKGGGGELYQSAYHGSPYLFDQFSLDHIGAGEGAQAFGWGLYFAGDKSVADSYRRNLSDDEAWMVDGERYILTNNGFMYEDGGLVAYDSFLGIALRLAHDNYGDINAAKSEIKKLIEFEEYHEGTGEDNLGVLGVESLQLSELAELESAYRGNLEKMRAKYGDNLYAKMSDAELSKLESDETAFFRLKNKLDKDISSQPGMDIHIDDEYLNVLREAEALLENSSIERAEPGQLYEVDIPDDYELLDLDKSLSDQSPQVQKALNRLVEVLPENALDDLGGDISLLLGRENTGSDLYGTVKSLVGGAQQASELLNSLGIKGNKYLDGSSRSAGEGSYNYVIFDDSALEILKEYYQSVASDTLGSLQVKDNAYIITLFKDANLSTLLHETGHIFLEEMERIKDLGLGDAQFIADYKAIHEWWSRFDEEATFRAEYDARLKNKPNFDGKKFEELTPEERAKARKIVEKEYFARGFEAYLLEGKAPAPELDGAFKRFRKWLLQLYVDVSRALGVELNDNIRGVFDRMLASDLEIERAAFNDEMLSAGIHAEKLSLSPEELAQMNRLQGAVKEQAVRILTEQRGKSLQARKALWRREAKEEYGANPVNTPLRMVYKDGYKLDPEAVKAYLGDDGYKLLHKKLGPGAFEAGGNDLETLAIKLAYDFPDDKNLVNSADRAADGLADTLLHVPSEASFVKDYVDSREKEFSASVNPEEALYETEEAARLAFKMGDYAARKAGKTNVSDETIARVAFDLMSSMPTRRAISFKQTFNDMRRASARWGKALAAGDFVKAFEANLQYRVNLELYKMARDNSDTLKKAGKKLNSFLRSKVVKGDEGSDAKYAASWISQKFSMRPAQKVDATLAEGRSVETIANWLKELEAEKYPLAIPDWIFTGPAQRAKDLTWEQTGELLDTLSGIIEVGKTRNTVLLDGRRVELAEAVNSATSEILEHHKIKFDDPREQGIISTAINKVDMLHTKVENLLEILDGKPMGTNWELLYRPVREGVNWLSKANKRLSKILMSKTEGFEQYSASERLNMSSKKFFVQEVGKSFTREQAIMIAANMGTESNLDRLISGEGWTIEQAQAVTNSILTDARDWRLVQSIWKSFEEFRDEAFDVNKRVTGIRPKPVSGIAVQTPFGEIQGGYFRISYDNRTVPADVQERLENASSIQAMTETGQYKERAAKGLQGARLQLDFGVIEFRLNQLLADIAFREAGINVSKILKNKKYMDTIQKTIGVDGYNTLVNWLKDSINEQVQKSWVDSFLRWGRVSATAVNMGFKITTILQQPLGLLQGVDRIGLGNMTKGLFAVYFGGGELPGSPDQMRGIKSRIGWVRSKSAFMDSRMGNYDRDMADAIRALDKSVSPDNLLDMALAKTGLLPATRAVQKNMFLPIALAQFYGVDVIVWAGAYQKGIKDFHGDEAKAVEYADQAVRMTQGSGDKLDLSGIQRGPELVKLLTTFYSYFNVLYNMTAMRVKDVAVKRDVASVVSLARSFVLLYLIPSLLGELLSGRGPDDEDDWLDWAAVKLASYGMGTVVGVRNFSSVLEGYEVQFMPSERGVDAASSFLSEISKAMRDDKKSKPEKLAKYGARTLGYAFRLPEGQAEITIGAMLEYLNGTNEDAEIRDLFFKKKK